MNYRELKDSILRWLDYTDDETTAELDNFIESAEKEAARMLRIKMNESFVKLPMYTKNRDVAVVPDNYLESKEMFMSVTGRPIQYTTLSDLLRKRSGIDRSVTGSGFYYARMADDFVFFPCIPEDEEVMFIYYADTENMKKDGDTSVVLDIAPFLVLYLSLKVAMLFLKNDEDAAKYNQLAQNELNQLRQQMERMDNKPTMRAVPKRIRTYF